MTYKTVLAIIQSEEDADRVMDFTLPFAARHGSHVIGLHAEALPIVIASPLGGPAVDFTLELSAEATRRSAALKERFLERTRTEGVRAGWRGYENVSGDSAISGIESARASDLVIAQQNDPGASTYHTANVEALIFESGRPVLLVPYIFKGRSSPFKKVLVAWNGSKEAARAAFDALPLMSEAEEVEILSVDPRDTLDQDAPLSGTAIATALARHGLNVITRTEQSGSLSHGEVIANRLADTGADLLVMGAFGRSRLSEFVFGGVTRSTLQSMTTPTLMAR
ncbi:universal stress protein [Chelativorans sp. Marseille-P2723]|uniref:universal stress protein n=1 Tax=Chelativorans sp. Marseille-P2723 TaxID=2709133 RepID=UPI00156EBDE0|nr:universal stress protein [Chelativorans sp. Marseille-P2723]